MNHEQMRDEVMALFDGELSLDRVAAVQRHLNDCAECRALSQTWRGTSDLLSSDRRPPSETFVSAVMTRLNREDEIRNVPILERLRAWILPAIGVAAFAGYVALMVATTSEGTTSTTAVLYAEVEEQLPAAWPVSTATAQDRSIDVVSEEI